MNLRKARKLQVVGIASALAFTLAACGADEDFDTPAGSEPTSATDPSESVSPHDPEGSETDSDSSSDADSDGESGTDDATTDSDIDLASDETPITASDALDISSEEVEGGDAAIVHAIELEYSSSSDRWEWSVKTLVDGTDNKVKIDADSGEIIKHEEDSTDDEEKAIDLDDPMSFSEARDLALDKRDGRISSWKYEWDDGRYEWQFDIDDGSDTEEVTVDAETGATELD